MQYKPSFAHDVHAVSIVDQLISVIESKGKIKLIKS